VLLSGLYCWTAGSVNIGWFVCKGAPRETGSYILVGFLRCLSGSISIGLFSAKVDRERPFSPVQMDFDCMEA